MEQESSKQVETKTLSIADVISRLQSLTKYEATIGGGCDCCGSWVEHEVDNKYGDWVKFDDIKALIKELQANSL